MKQSSDPGRKPVLGPEEAGHSEPDPLAQMLAVPGKVEAAGTCHQEALKAIEVVKAKRDKVSMDEIDGF